VYILALAALADTTALFTHTLVRPRARIVPAWVPGLGGRPVRPRLVVVALLLPTAILVWRAALHLPLILDGFRIPEEVTGVPSWSLWAQAALTWIWAGSLAATTLAYSRATRSWPA
jgi:hypothetical protein